MSPIDLMTPANGGSRPTAPFAMRSCTIPKRRMSKTPIKPSARSSTTMPSPGAGTTLDTTISSIDLATSTKVGLVAAMWLVDMLLSMRGGRRGSVSSAITVLPMSRQRRKREWSRSLPGPPGFSTRLVAATSNHTQSADNLRSSGCDLIPLALVISPMTICRRSADSFPTRLTDRVLAPGQI